VHANVKHAQRGQAVIETVIFLPLFLIALFGIIWTVQAAVQYERVESAVRYAGLISQEANPYAEYSLYALYGQLGSATMPTFVCVTPLADPLSDASPTYHSSSYANTASAPFWSPASSTPSCPSAGLVGFPVGTTFGQDVILSQQDPGITSTIKVPSAVLKLPATTLTQASERFFRPVGLNVILACYPSLDTQLTSSLKYQTDASSAVMPTALGNSVTAITPSAISACVTP
jgi:hypothetical protein